MWKYQDKFPLLPVSSEVQSGVYRILMQAESFAIIYSYPIFYFSFLIRNLRLRMVKLSTYKIYAWTLDVFILSNLFDLFNPHNFILTFFQPNNFLSSLNPSVEEVGPVLVQHQSEASVFFGLIFYTFFKHYIKT